MKIDETIVTPGGWLATVKSGKAKGGAIAIVWLTGPLKGRDARILHKGCRVVNPSLARPKPRRRGRIITRSGEVIG